MELPKRKPNRLKDYDYSTQGAYFITICTKDRKETLSKISVGAIHELPEIRLTPKGNIINEIICTLPLHSGAEIDTYVIMPNHIHLIIFVKGEQRVIRESPLRARSTVSKTIGYIKMNSSKRIHQEIDREDVFQRSFYDRIIRNREEYEEISKYIYENPINWETDELYM